MSSTLATRCPTCSTVFRVVPDQLRVSEGWVRCGRCSEVFNAAEVLIDMETGAARRWEGELPLRGSPRPTAASSAASEAGTGTTAPAGPGLAPLSQGESAANGGGGDGDGDPLIRDPAAAAEDKRAADSEARSDTVHGEAALTELSADGPPGHITPRAAKGAPPSFMRKAERAARWHRPRVRVVLALVALALTLALLVQIGAAYRDLAAARFPQLRPLLAQGCAVLGCRLEPARAIGSLEVESSGLVQIEKSSVYRLSVALRNRAGIDLALPALELVLSDSQGRLVARRVLTAAELGVASDTIGAGGGLSLRASLQAALPGGASVAGYTIELFYP